MATEIRMPRIGHSMTEGTVVAWLAKPGEAVRAGQAILTIETDKAEYEVEAPADGVLAEPLFGEGATAAVGAVLGHLLAPGEHAAPPPRPALAHPESRRRAPGSGADLSPKGEVNASLSASPRWGEAGGLSPSKAPGEGETRAAARVRASPKARRLAAERGVDLARLRGSGPDGLVTEADVERAAKAPARAEAEGWNGRPVRERRPLSPIRRTTARRMTEAWTRIPHIVQMIDVDMTAVRSLRELWKMEGGERATVGFNDFVVRAAARALAEHPDLNAAVDGDDLVLFAEVNAGIAVDTPRGLLVPVIRGADRLALPDLAREARRLAAKARGPGLEPGDSAAGTFTVSNLGAFGIRAGTPVLNPPESVLVFVGAVEERPVVREGAVVVRPIATLSIAYDHRVADGAAAARVTGRIRELLESASL